MQDMQNNNTVKLIGKLVSGFALSHEISKEKFYTANLSVDRLSKNIDTIPILVPEKLLDLRQNYMGYTMEIDGQYRSCRHNKDGRYQLILYVLVKEINISKNNIENSENIKTNQIFLDGYVCGKPVYRRTPKEREITQLLLIVNRTYGRTDCIPCIAWGRNARLASGMEAGTRITLQGRIQSREYTKKINEVESEKRITHEVSISKMEIEN